MTCLSIAQMAASWVIPGSVPTSLFPSTDPQIVQLRTLLNEELTELRKWPDAYWRKLIRQKTFVSVAAEIQTDTPIPTDYDYMIPSTMWDRTMARPCVGPLTPQDWQAWQARPIVTSWLWGFRLRGNDFLTAPTPPAGDTVAYEYISKLAVYATGDTVPTKEYFTDDTDTTIFDETMMARGLRWRFVAAKGLDYREFYREWSYLVQREVSRSKGMQVLNTAGPLYPDLAGPYTPSFSFPGP